MVHTVWGAKIDVDVLVYLKGIENRALGGIVSLPEGEGEDKGERDVEEAWLVEAVLARGIFSNVHRGFANIRQARDEEPELARLGDDELLDLGEIGEGPPVAGEAIEVEAIGELPERAHDRRLHHLLRRPLVGADEDGLVGGDVDGARGDVDQVVGPPDHVGLPDPVVGVVGVPDGVRVGSSEVDPGGEAEEGVGLEVGVVEGAVQLPELQRGDERLPRAGVGDADAEGGRRGQHHHLPRHHRGLVVDDDGGPARGTQVEVELREHVAAVEVAVQEAGPEQVACPSPDAQSVAVLACAAAAAGRGGEVAHRGVPRALLRRHRDVGRGSEGEPPGVACPHQTELVRVVAGTAAVDAHETLIIPFLLVNFPCLICVH
jgi:hypothetical protein